MIISEKIMFSFLTSIKFFFKMDTKNNILHHEAGKVKNAQKHMCRKLG